MECPNCKVELHPQMFTGLIGVNSRGRPVWVFYEMCPKCKEPIVGYRQQRENEWIIAGYDVEGLSILTRKE